MASLPDPVAPPKATSSEVGAGPGTGGWAGRLEASGWMIGVAYRAAPRLVLVLALSTVVSGMLPAAIAWVGRQIVDAVVDELASGEPSWSAGKSSVLGFVGLEAALAVALLVAQRAATTAQSLLRLRLGHAVGGLLLDKAVSLDLAQLEEPETNERMVRARKDAATRPYELVVALFTLARTGVVILSAVALLTHLSWWAGAIVLLAGLPAFVAELRFSAQAWDQQRRRSPTFREQAYLEHLLTRDDAATELRTYALGPTLLGRYRDLSQRIEDDARRVTVQRGLAGTVLNAVGTGFFYFGYAWIVRRTIHEHLSVGEMTMYLALFRQAQSSVATVLVTLGGLLDHHLYLVDLRSFLALEPAGAKGGAEHGPDPAAGLEFEDVWFTYPGAHAPALRGVSFRVRPGELVALVGENGSGKSTLLRLALRLYAPQEGTIRLEGLDVRAWDAAALRRRFALVFQDFLRLKLAAGENVGAGDVTHFHDEAAWRQAAERGLADPILSALPAGYHTPLGKWNRGGQELSGGQWQKVALSRAYMRPDASVLVLDEPSSALDPEAESRLFDQVREATRGDDATQMVILVSHRFGTVRSADRIVVLDQGRIAEQGTHESLMAEGGRYQRLFQLQAAGFAETLPARGPREPDEAPAAEG